MNRTVRCVAAFAVVSAILMPGYAAKARKKRQSDFSLHNKNTKYRHSKIIYYNEREEKWIR